MLRDKFSAFFPFTILLLNLCGLQSWAQQVPNYRRTAMGMLDAVSKDVQKYYYDPKFHGVDWRAEVRDTKAKIKTSDSINQGMEHIAQALQSLHDSHTSFLPPFRDFICDYDFRMEMIGDHCYVSSVRPGSDAEGRGVMPGDEVMALEGFQPNRDILGIMEYRYNLLRPQTSLQLALRSPQGRERQVEVKAKWKQLQHIRYVTVVNFLDVIREVQNQAHPVERLRWTDLGNDVVILRLPIFAFEQSLVDDLLGKARNHRAIILDLRGNPGGTMDSLRWLVGGMFDKDVKIADRVGRQKYERQLANARSREVFGGKLVVLVDSRSASAAEVFARLVQLEKRGVVIGDRSSGSVMQAKIHPHMLHTDRNQFIVLGAEITEANLVMADGKSLEHVGVTPDELLLPTAADLAAGRDPVLARAAALVGAKLTPEQAGKMFPYEWPHE
jgi:carboxyl-terminal processing protease